MTDAIPSRPANPEDFSHSWFMCEETGEVAVNRSSTTAAICPTHRTGHCLRVYVPLGEVRIRVSDPNFWVECERLLAMLERGPISIDGNGTEFIMMETVRNVLRGGGL